MHQQDPAFKPTAPLHDQPPPYSAVMAESQSGTYPNIGFVPPVNTAPPNTYPHPVPPQTTPFNTYPHPQGGYPIQPNVILTSQTQMPVNVIVRPPLGTDSTSAYCTTCNAQVMTKVTYATSWHTHLIAGIVCFTTMLFSMCCLGLIPYCMDSCKNAEHYCPNCNSYLGRFERC